jgi:hypothetical protein
MRQMAGSEGIMTVMWCQLACVSYCVLCHVSCCVFSHVCPFVD